MSFALGVTLFAVALLLSVAWHECGHMWAARATGMKVRRYFVGFGPTVWSTRRGETEYGLKAIPLGGFCDIAGMTPHENLTTDEYDRAMYRQKAWKRLVVLIAGPAQNFVLGFALILIAGLAWGLPNLDPVPSTVASTQCVSATITQTTGEPVEYADCEGGGPAADAGLLPGDRIVAADGQRVELAEDLTPIIRESSGPIVLTIDRDGREFDATMTPQQTRIVGDVRPDDPTSFNMVGITYEQPPRVNNYNLATIVPGSVVFTKDLAIETWNRLLELPSKIAPLWHAVTGGDRDPETPVSVYGASVMGGQTVERGEWATFLMLLIAVNFFLGLFNLVPLLPLDGGHMAIVGYEKGRDTVRRWFGRAPGGPVDYFKLMPVTYAVIAVMAGFMVLTLTADIVNPIQIF